MKALVFGATSGIGLACSKSLSSTYEVIGIGRDISKVNDDKITFMECDLCDREKTRKLLSNISCPDVLVFSAGSAYYGLHENIESYAIEEMVKADLLSPIDITNHYLQQMKQRKSGHIIFVSSVTADSVNTHGACYGACKAGIRSFAKSLFEEVRKTGVKVSLLTPDLTDTDLYRNADFKVDPELVLKPSDISEALLFALEKPANVDVFDITIRPMRNAIVK